MKKNSRLFKVGFLVICLLLLVACGSKTSGKPQIVFGMAAPMTGNDADYGIDLQKGVGLAIDEINAAGGINGQPVKLEVCDDKADPSAASLCAQKFVSESYIFAAIGNVNSTCTLAAGPIYDKAGLTDITGDSTNSQITQMGWTHMFRTIINDKQQGPGMVQIAVKTLGKSKLAIMYANSDYGNGLLNTAVPAITALGAQMVDAESYTPGDKDFSAQLTKIALAQPDALLLMTDYTEGGLILKQRIAAGLGNIAVIASAANVHPEFISLGGAGAEGAFVMTDFDPGQPTPLVQKFVATYKAKYGSLPDEMGAYGYEIPYIYKWAIDQGATKTTLPAVLHKVDYTGVTGEIQFDAKGDLIGGSRSLLQIQNGQFVSYVSK
jgi:branched-chain amino acid transport system substrate-binding protein